MSALHLAEALDHFVVPVDDLIAAEEAERGKWSSRYEELVQLTKVSGS
jgi:hypothetical protein